VNKLITVASIVTYACLTLLIAAFALNAWGVVTGRFDYHCEANLFSLIEFVLGASSAVWTGAFLSMYRKEKAEERAFNQEKIPTIQPDSVTVLVERKDVPKYEEAIDCIVVTNEKTNDKIEERNCQREEHLNVLMPENVTTFWDGEISLPPPIEEGK